MSPLTLFLFFTIVLAIQGLLQLPMNFKISFSISAKKDTGILIRIALNLEINLGSTVILTVLNIPTQKYRVTSHLSSLISYRNVL